MTYRELLLGCGHRRKRDIDPYPFYVKNSQRLQPARLLPETHRWQKVVTVDLNPGCDPDLVMDLSDAFWLMDRSAVRRWQSEVLEETDDGVQFKANSFDELHAYEVLEHLGPSGAYERLFGQFDEMWRILKPGGFLCASCPSRYSIWAWGDPGHSRIISEATITFLRRPHYDGVVGCTPSSDYRSVFVGDFDIVHSYDNEETFTFVLQAVKPARPPK